MLFLRQCITQAQTDLAVDVNHRPIRKPEDDCHSRSARNDDDTILTQFRHQSEWHSELRKIQWKDLPNDKPTPIAHGVFDRPTFLIVHLFSGRRRESDVHWHLVQMARGRGRRLRFFLWTQRSHHIMVTFLLIPFRGNNWRNCMSREWSLPRYVAVPAKHFQLPVMSLLLKTRQSM